jgi:hypothetical protein
MKITNKITKRDVSKEYLGLMMGLITNQEFEEVTCTRPTKYFHGIKSKYTK